MGGEKIQLEISCKPKKCRGKTFCLFLFSGVVKTVEVVAGMASMVSSWVPINFRFKESLLLMAVPGV